MNKCNLPAMLNEAGEETEARKRTGEELAPVPTRFDMKLLIAACWAGMTLLAQMPVRVDVYTHKPPAPPDYMGPVYRALEQGVDTAARIRQSQIEEGWLDLARQRDRRLAEMERESRRLQDRVLDPNFGYKDFRSGAADWRINQDVMDAVGSARKQHNDFDALLPAMRICGGFTSPTVGKDQHGRVHRVPVLHRQDGHICRANPRGLNQNSISSGPSSATSPRKSVAVRAGGRVSAAAGRIGNGTTTLLRS